MAFQFVPNPDGGFTEGDKQTNPESGVEYMFHDGAWRPLGPEYNEQIQDFDDRYLRLDGGTLTGDLTLKNSKDLIITKSDDTKQFQIKVNSSDYFTNTYSFYGAGMRFRVGSDDRTDTAYGTGLIIKKATHDVGSSTYTWMTEVNYLKNPTNPGHAANKQYVDDRSSTITSGTDTNPTLATGQLYYNTSTKQLFIGE